MRKTSFEYHIHGYRYAPESFHIYKGLPGQEKTELPLSDEQRYQMGYLYLTQGIKSAVDYVKHIERERERKCRLYMTYGFMLKENPRSYVYCADLRCRENDPLAVRLHTLRAFREHLAQSGGRIEQSVECELDGRYRPIHTRKNYVTADFDRPIVVWLNPYFGEIRMDDRSFEVFKVYQEFSGQFHAVITIPQGNKATLGKDLEMLFAKRQSFATAINSSQSIVMRSRLSRYWNELVSVVEQAAIAF